MTRFHLGSKIVAVALGLGLAFRPAISSAQLGGWVQQQARSASNTVKSGGGAVSAGVKSAGKSVSQTTKQQVGKAVNSGKSAGGKLAQGGKSTAKRAAKTTRSAGKSASTGLKSTGRTLSKAGTSTVKSASNGARSLGDRAAPLRNSISRQSHEIGKSFLPAGKGPFLPQSAPELGRKGTVLANSAKEKGRIVTKSLPIPQISRTDVTREAQNGGRVLGKVAGGLGRGFFGSQPSSNSSQGGRRAASPNGGIDGPAGDAEDPDPGAIQEDDENERANIPAEVSGGFLKGETPRKPTK